MLMLLLVRSLKGWMFLMQMVMMINCTNDPIDFSTTVHSRSYCCCFVDAFVVAVVVVVVVVVI